MIKINLLAEGKRPIIARKAKANVLQINEANAANWAMAGALLVGIVAALVWYFLLASQVKSKQQEIRVAQKEVDELQQVIKEVQEYETKLKELNHKVEVITTLKENQRGPVVIMDEVSRALPDLVWLTRMDVSPTAINFQGSAFNMSAVANFIDNLDRVEAFREPILRDTRRARSRGTSELYSFSLGLYYSFKKPEATKTGEVTRPAAGGSGALASALAAKAANEKGVE